MAGGRRALISVSDKAGVVEFARGLVELGWEIISTGGTLKELRGAGLPVTYVSDVTGFPEILGGRVKTLHPAIHGGILAVREDEHHAKDLAAAGIKPIDLVAVNLYPFARAVQQRGITLAEAVEEIDIGGPAMVRAAAKNYRYVTVVVDPARYGRVLELLRREGEVPLEVRLELAAEAFAHTALYDSLISSYLSRVRAEGERELFPDRLVLGFEKVQSLRYGENPHQRAAFYRDPLYRGPSLAAARQLQGKELSFNNINDAAAALELVLEFPEPTAVAVKHATPCGVASGATIAEAFARAHAADPISIFGGIVALNRPVDEEAARALREPFLEIVLAPEFAPEALAVLSEKKNLRLLALPELVGGQRESYWDWKRVPGGLLLQDADLGWGDEDDPSTWRVVTEREPAEEDWPDLLFAWRVVKHARSNAIVVARRKQTLGIGAGQVNRIDPTRYALARAGEAARGAVLASDGFFPLPDVVEAAAEAGIRAIVQPGGSLRDGDSIAAANRAGIAMVFTGVRHFKH
ncbi:MAG: bifunctional phosphoribosylaminoimidazolecarboxamide formyltransferase/IMP cyclohydrolase [Bacillota bacterium]|nr:bifunctional phosphoribosylaminoimidazolecarboxamide formyltransferase/IMP cyclohydrolase [Bacillota bacterium]